MSASVRVGVTVAADPTRAFRAFTEELSAWWRPHPLFATTPRAPGVLALEDGRLVERLEGGRSFEVGRVSLWEPPRRFAFTWRPASLDPELATVVEVRFEPADEGTRVTVTHGGWSAIPAAHVARHGFPDAALLRRAAEWWEAQLGRYKRQAGADSIP